jgi:hypothetical protein
VCCGTHQAIRISSKRFFVDLVAEEAGLICHSEEGAAMHPADTPEPGAD